jgi:Nucleotidyl transferase AbiEii toxin, Type IV TA system
MACANGDLQEGGWRPNMTEKKTYKTAKAFRAALEERLKAISRKENIDLQRLRIQVSFDRLLARLFAKKPAPWVLKGGYAMQLRLQNARATKDVDLAMKEARFISGTKEEKDLALLGLLQERTGEDIGDFFVFTIGLPIMDLDAAPYGGSRFPVEAQMDGRSFVKFQMDVGIGDAWIEPLEMLTSRGFLEFAGLEAQTYPAISREQQFAEKIHAYTVPRESANSRVKDLVDMILLISAGKLDSKKLASAIQATFERRATHKFDANLKAPPAAWERPFGVMAKECGLAADIDSAFQTALEFLKKL